MSLKETLQVVETCPLFEGLTNREKYYILRYFKPCRYPRGAVVVCEGEIVNELAVIASGTWEVFLPRNEDYLYRRKEVKLQVLTQAGSLVGEYSFIDGMPASASVRALEVGDLYSISREDFAQIVESSNRIGKLIYKNLLDALVERLRKHNEDLDLQYLMDG